MTTAPILVSLAGPPIPAGCICSYTWRPDGTGFTRNGPLSTCPADHTEVDK